MRTLSGRALGFGLATATSSVRAMTPMESFHAKAPLAVTKVEYFCSPGFVPTYGGRCEATAVATQIELFLNEPVEEPVVRHHHRRHALHERY